MGNSEKELQQFQYLIPGLPDEIALDCLIRIPNRFHSNLKSVCRNWRNLVTHPSFYRERQKSGTAEHLVCLVQPITTTTTTTTTTTIATADIELPESAPDKSELRQRHCPPLYGLTIYNVNQDNWYRMIPNTNEIPSIPMFCQCVALPASGKILLLGGWDPTTLESVPDVYIYDFIHGGGWRCAAPMTVARSFFACAAVGSSSVYVAGGHDNQKNALRSAEVYDADTDEWRILPCMAEERDECQGLSCEGDSRFWVVSGYGTESQGQFNSDAECYDPAIGAWTKIDNVWPFPNASPRGTTTTTTSEKWWFVGSGGGGDGGGGGGGEQRGVREYDGKEKRWKVAVSIPDSILIRSSLCVAPLRGGTTTGGAAGGGGGGENRIFVMGSGDRDRHSAFILETSGSSRSNNKWTELHNPSDFSGFVYSASSLLI